MTLRTKLLMAVFVAGMASAPAAAIVTFTLTGDATAQFTLPSSPVPSNVGSNSFELTGQTGTFRGTFGSFNLFFYDAGLGGGFDINDPSETLTFVSAAGPVLFTGTLAAPTFSLGTFSLTDFGEDSGSYTLTIANAVPEPESWALLIAGFGLTGAAMRRRRVIRKVA